MTGRHPHHGAPRFGFYTDTFMYRSEVFFYRQATGMRDAHVQVLARQGALLDEFPFDDMFLVDEFRKPLERVRIAAGRALDRSTASRSHLRDYAVRRLARHLDRQPVDVVYTMFGWHASQMLDVLDSMKRPVPLVFLAGGSDIVAAASLEAGYLDRLHLAFERASRILAASRFLMEQMRAMGAPDEKLHLHYIGIDIPPEADTLPPPADSTFTILAVSRLLPVKGLPHTLRAMARVVEAVPEARLDVIGDGVERVACEQLAVDLGLSDRVTFHGSASIAEVYTAMANADVFVQHSIRTPKGEEEGLGLSIVEAAAHGLPVVATRTGGIPEGVIHDVTGFLIEPGNEAGMADALIALARDPDRRRRMGAAGRERMIRHFDVRAQNAKLEDILTEVAMQHRCRHG